MIKAYNNIPSYETEIKSSSRIFIAGHNGMVGSAMVRKLKNSGYNNLILVNRDELDLLSQNSVKSFMSNFVLNMSLSVQLRLAVYVQTIYIEPNSFMRIFKYKQN